MSHNATTLLPKPHIFVVPFTGHGHVIPMMFLAKKLVANGCAVTLVNTEYNVRHMLSTASKARLEEMGIRLESVSDGLPLEFDRAAGGRELFQAVTKMGKALEDLLEKVMQDHERGPVTCILSDLSMLCTQDVANKFGIPRAALWPQNAAAYASHVTVSRGFRSHSENSTEIRAVGALVNSTDLSNLLQILHSVDRFMFNFCIDPFLRLAEATWILVNTFEELESSELDALQKDHKLYTVGPLLPSSLLTDPFQPEDTAVSFWPAEHHCIEWLDRHAPSSVVYVSFGSVTVLSESNIHELALGLEASDQPFLWVVRPDWIRSESGALPLGFKDRIGSRGLIISWAPQLQVLTHISVGGFLTHCGWNSTLESIVAGVPMIGRPGFGDQELNCRLVVDVWKVGVRVEGGKEGDISSREVEAKVRCVMVGEEGREARGRVRVLREAAKLALLDSNGGVERFVEEVKKGGGRKVQQSVKE